MKTLTILPLVFCSIISSCKKKNEPQPQASVPVVLTTAISGITSSSALSGGTITSEGGSAVTGRGVCWSTNPSPSINDNVTVDGAGTGSFVSSITGLTSDSTYYARAYGTNSIGTGYGKIVSFTPTPATPIDYLGQTPPSLTPEPFAHYIFENFALHSSPAFSPDGNEVFWSSFNMGLPGNYKLQLWCMKQENNIWGEPQIATFLLNGIGDSPVFSPDGQTLFFLSGTPTPNNPNNTKENLYYAAKTETSWSEPVLLGQNFDDYTFHWQVSLAGNRNLYFSGYPTALITDFERDIMLAQYQNGTYGNFVNLGDSVNTPDQLECTPCVAPDERFLIFSRGGTSDFSDLYISFKKTDGTWTTAKNMTGVNSPFHDLNPLLTPDGKYLIFTSGQDGWPYWVDASVIEQYR